MILAECRTYDQFKTGYTRLMNWTAAANGPVPPPVLYSSVPGVFTVFALYVGVMLRFSQDGQPESFRGDFPDAIEVGGLGIV